MTDLTFKHLSEVSSARSRSWGGASLGVLFRAVELGGEVGEALNIVKKLERQRLDIAGSRATVAQLADELADVIICVDRLASWYGINLGQAVIHKFNMTSEAVGLEERL